MAAFTKDLIDAAAQEREVTLVTKGRSSGKSRAVTIWISTDGAQSFIASGTPNSTATSAILTGSEAGAPTLYTALLVSGTWKLYRSDDGGASWTYTIDITDMWDGSLCASTLFQNLVMFGGTEVWRSTNSGVSFAKINGWGEYYGNPAHKLHADCPGIFCWPVAGFEPGADQCSSRMMFMPAASSVAT